MKIIIFILAAMLAIVLAAPAPAPEAEAEADPQYYLSEDFEDTSGALDASYPDSYDEPEPRLWRLKLFCRIPWNRIKRVCRRITGFVGK